MIDIATHVRIFDAEPDDDLVAKRTAAIKTLGALYGKSRQVPAILQTANDLAAAAAETKAKVSDAMAKEVETAIREAGAEAFVAEGQDLQMKVCALLAAMQLLEETTPPTGDVTAAAILAIGLWSALSFQAQLAQPKFESLRCDVMAVAHRYVMASASSSRQRTKVADAAVAAAEPFDAANVVKSINNGLGKVFKALQTNAAMDREELDLLWWVLSDWSTLLERRYSSMTNSVTAALAAGIEAGMMLRRLPADAHRHLVLRHVKQGPAVSLTDVVSSLGDDRALLARGIPDHKLVASCPAIFPLLSAVISGSSTHGRAKQKHTVSDWAGRALLETAAVHVTSLLPVTV